VDILLFCCPAPTSPKRSFYGTRTSWNNPENWQVLVVVVVVVAVVVVVVVVLW